jgi:putative transposase
VAFVMTEYRLSERQACKLLDLDRASYRYEARPDRNLELRHQLVALARQKPRFGYRRLWHMLTKSRLELSMSRVYRLYRKERLAVRRIARKKLRTGAAVNALLKRPNQEWAIDFMSDALATGRGIRLLTMVDGFTRECPAIEVAPSLSSRRVTRVLERVITQRGVPDSLRCDNGLNATEKFCAGTHGSSNSRWARGSGSIFLNAVLPVVFHTTGTPLTIMNTRSAVTRSPDST